MGAKDYAIIVGVSHYYHDSLKPLPGAVEDAKRFLAWVCAPDGGAVPRNNVKVILSSDHRPPKDYWDAQPKKQMVDGALREFGIGDSEPQPARDRLYFYFTGHGVAPGFDDLALLMASAARDWPDDNLGFPHYHKYLHEVSTFRNVIFFLDCCRTLDDHVIGQSPGRNRRLSLTKRGFRPGNYVMYAASHEQNAYEPPDPETKEHRGLFTKALLEGLQGRKAANADKRVTAASLKKYLKERVPQLAKEAGAPHQEPDFELSEQDLEFGRAASLPHVRIHVTAAAGLGGTFVLEDGMHELREVDRREVSSDPWELYLQVPGYYVLKHLPSGEEKLIGTETITANPHVYHFG